MVDERLVVGVGPDDPWSERTTVSIAELRDRTLVSLPLGTGLRGALDGACAAAGFRPRIAFESGDLGVVADLAARGLGVAILAGSVALARPDLRGVAIEPAVRSSLALAWRAEGPSSPAGRALVAHARSAIPEVDSAARLSRYSASRQVDHVGVLGVQVGQVGLVQRGRAVGAGVAHHDRAEAVLQRVGGGGPHAARRGHPG